MILAKPWYHIANICEKKSFNTIKNCKKLKWCTLQLQVAATVLFNTILTFTK